LEFAVTETVRKLEEFMEIEHFFTCPYCGEEISVILDLSAGAQSYIEDCEICCRPIEIAYEVDGDQLGNFSADALDE
jgi:transcription elongation factor Elf1